MEFARYFAILRSMKDSIINRFGKLPLSLKLIGVGSALTFVSVFLPWYSDLDKFNTGDGFIGVSGPLYLLGFLIMALAVSSLALFGARILEKKVPSLPLEEAHYHMFVGGMSLFLLVITSSIYFHSKFGVNITMKEMRFGMIMSFVGSFLILFGGLKMNKGRDVSFETSGKLDKLIDVKDPLGQDRVQKDIKISRAEPESVRENVAVSIESEVDTSVGGAYESEKTEKQNLF